MSKYRIVKRPRIDAVGRNIFIYVIQSRFLFWWSDVEFQGGAPNVHKSVDEAKESIDFFINNSTDKVVFKQ